MMRARFFATLRRARLLKRIGLTRAMRKSKLVSFQGGFIEGYFARR